MTNYCLFKQRPYKMLIDSISHTKTNTILNKTILALQFTVWFNCSIHFTKNKDIGKDFRCPFLRFHSVSGDAYIHTNQHYHSQILHTTIYFHAKHKRKNPLKRRLAMPNLLLFGGTEVSTSVRSFTLLSAWTKKRRIFP